MTPKFNWESFVMFKCTEVQNKDETDCGTWKPWKKLCGN